MSFNLKIVELARFFRGLTQNELASKIECYNQGSLSKIEAGQLNVSLKHIEDFSRILKMPVPFFLQKELPGEGAVFHYHLVKKLDDKKMASVIAEMKIIATGIDKIFSGTNLGSINNSIHLNDKTPKQVAQIIRKYLQVPPNKLGDTTTYLQNSLIIVHRHKFDNSSVSGINIRTQRGIWIIILNSDVTVNSHHQSETIAYQLGYLIYIQNTSIIITKRHPVFVEHFANEYLLPSDYCEDSFQKLTIGKLEYLSRKWGLSMLFIVKRAKMFSYQKPNTLDYLCTESKRRFNKKKNGRVIEQSHEGNLADKIYNLKKAKNLINEDLASSTNLYLEDFKRLFLI